MRDTGWSEGETTAWLQGLRDQPALLGSDGYLVRPVPPIMRSQNTPPNGVLAGVAAFSDLVRRCKALLSGHSHHRLGEMSIGGRAVEDRTRPKAEHASVFGH